MAIRRARKTTQRTAVRKAATPRAKPAKRATGTTRRATKAKPPARKATKKAKRRALPIPAGYHTVNPYLVVRGAGRALDFYTRAFGARETTRMAMPDGSVMHAEMKIGDSMIMLADENPEWGSKSPEALGGSPMQVMLYVRDVDAFVARAAAAGATIEMPVAVMFWGDRYGKVRDPFGHVWSVATHVEDVPPKEMRRRMDEFLRQGPPPAPND